MGGTAIEAEDDATEDVRIEGFLSFKTWLVEQRDTCTPKSPLGSAIGYALDNWTPLTRLLDDEKLPPTTTLPSPRSSSSPSAAKTTSL